MHLRIGTGMLAKKYSKESDEGATFRQLAEARDGGDISGIVINENTLAWAKVYATEWAESEWHRELSEQLKTRIAEYESHFKK